MGIRFFNETSTQSRFAKSKELKHLLILITAFKEKRDSLKKDADTNGSGSLDFKKYVAFYGAVKDIKNALHQFNQAPCSNLQDNEILQMILLTQEIKSIVEKYYILHKETLLKPRNNYKKTANTLIRWATIALVGLGTACASSFSLFLSAASMYSAGWLEKQLRSNYGFDNLTPESAQLFGALEITSKEIIANLKRYLDYKNNSETNTRSLRT
ncbi:MAG: hypothetical protein H0W64_10345 [Gammaproteobacteria bacterium]|nr:hypothetical protein [Gammaproteobacteria bacterium]